jgi:Caspase domain
MRGRALLVGVDRYEHLPCLTWCVDDALAMREVLQYHANHEPNFACHVLLGAREDLSLPAPVSDGSYELVTFTRLRAALEDLFAYEEMVVFYYSGHGYVAEQRTYLATQDAHHGLPGISLAELVEMANHSRAREVFLIVDSCFSGDVGEPLDGESYGDDVSGLSLRSGVTMLAAARRDQQAIEMDGHGMFTRLVLGALKGGAADVRGWVSAASIYAYVEQALGPWDQRPIYKSNADRLSPIRYCTPDVPDDELRRLPRLFPTPDHRFPMGPSYEVTSPASIPEHVAIFKLFKRYQVARLLRPTFAFDVDLYFVAMRNHAVELTPLGQFYWQLARKDLIGGTPAFPAGRRLRMPMPDAESVARLFHETYERLAPAFGYDTREATRVPWEEVPERNKRLMIATTAEVLAMLFAPGDEPPQGES